MNSTPIYYTEQGSAYVRTRDVPIVLKQDLINFLYGMATPVISGVTDTVWLHDYVRFLKGIINDEQAPVR